MVINVDRAPRGPDDIRSAEARRHDESCSIVTSAGPADQARNRQRGIPKLPGATRLRGAPLSGLLRVVRRRSRPEVRISMPIGRVLRTLAAILLVASVTSVDAGPVPAAAPALPPPVACAGCWRPEVRTSWDWVLSTVPKAPYRPVQLYDI